MSRANCGVSKSASTTTQPISRQAWAIRPTNRRWSREGSAADRSRRDAKRPATEAAGTLIGWDARRRYRARRRGSRSPCRSHGSRQPTARRRHREACRQSPSSPCRPGLGGHRVMPGDLAFALMAILKGRVVLGVVGVLDTSRSPSSPPSGWRGRPRCGVAGGTTTVGWPDRWSAFRRDAGTAGTLDWSTSSPPSQALARAAVEEQCPRPRAGPGTGSSAPGARDLVGQRGRRRRRSRGGVPSALRRRRRHRRRATAARRPAMRIGISTATATSAATVTHGRRRPRTTSAVPPADSRARHPVPSPSRKPCRDRPAPRRTAPGAR